MCHALRAKPTQVFGAQYGAKIYGVLFSAFAAASISGTFLTKVVFVSVLYQLSAYSPSFATLDGSCAIPEQHDSSGTALH